jgi:hypothetical protein
MNKYLPTILVAIIVGTGAFFGGIKYQQTKAGSLPNNFSNRQFGQMGQNGFRQDANGTNRQGFQPVSGEILSNDGKTITVKMTDGSSKIVLFNDKTTINKAESATTADLKAGEKVAVFGQTNSDGSVSAQNIQLNPVNRMAAPNTQ